MRQISRLQLIYGIYMILMGVVSVALIGSSAKTALISGGSMGLISIALSIFTGKEKLWAFRGGVIQSLLLIGIFSWRGSITFMGLLDKVQAGEDFFGKGIAFLVIMSMFVFSLISFTLHFINCRNEAKVTAKVIEPSIAFRK